jgi:hypothetical protein
MQAALLLRIIWLKLNENLALLVCTNRAIGEGYAVKQALSILRKLPPVNRYFNDCKKVYNFLAKSCANILRAKSYDAKLREGESLLRRRQKQVERVMGLEPTAITLAKNLGRLCSVYH